ncbi:MAG: hypothetical protein ABSC04_02640 [Syntrophobacteraceae bacterium]
MFRRVVRAAFGPSLGNLGVVFRRVVRAAFGPSLGNLGVVFRRVVRAAFGPALGNLGVVFRRVVRAAFGPALGNLGVVFRRVVRATEDCAKAASERVTQRPAAHSRQPTHPTARRGVSGRPSSFQALQGAVFSWDSMK